MLRTEPRGRPSATHADRRFRKYGPETSRAVRLPDVQENAIVRRLKEVFEEFNPGTGASFREQDRNYQKAVEAIEGIDYSAEDVKIFCLSLAIIRFNKDIKPEDEWKFAEKAGMFLSALINEGRDSEYVLSTTHIGFSIHRLGYKNEKSLIVDGDVGFDLGTKMQKGRIIVTGNSRGGVGEWMEGGDIIIGSCNRNVAGVGEDMKGGRIIVKGDIDGYIGDHMSGGIILVLGLATGVYASVGRETEIIGKGMWGGEIHIVDSCTSLVGGTSKAKIFIRGKQVYPKIESTN